MRPTFEVPLKSQIVNLGETAVFNCEVSGEPEPTVEWLGINDTATLIILITAISKVNFQ